MIYNRTYIDIINAKKIFVEKIQKFIELTDEEQGIIDKAYFNTKTINRIVKKINEIWGVIEVLGGAKVENEDVREWGDEEIFNIKNFSNIRKNIGDILLIIQSNGLMDISIYENAYNLLSNEYVYTNLNNMEKLLYDLDAIYNYLVAKMGNNLYIIGSYNAVLEEGELYIE